MLRIGYAVVESVLCRLLNGSLCYLSLIKDDRCEQS